MKKAVRRNQLLMLVPAILGVLIWTLSPLLVFNPVSADTYQPSQHLTFLQASLTGAPINNQTPFGRAEYKAFQNNVRRFSVHAYQVNLPAGTTLSVFINNTNVGQLTLNPGGSGRLELRSTHNQNVPTIAAGDTLTIRNGTTTVLSGTFNSHGTPPTGSPSPSGSATPSGTRTPTPTPVPNLYAALTGAPINGIAPTGIAQYRTVFSGRRLEVFVNNVNLPQGTALTVFIGETSIGQFTLRQGGQGEFESQSNLPTITAGTLITVRNGSTIILSGTFGINLPSPTPTPIRSPSPTPSGTRSPSPTPSGTGTPRPSPSGSPNASPTPRPMPGPARFFRAKLRGAQMVPPVNTQARGMANILLNAAGTEIQVFAGFFGLSSNQTTASINGPALPGATGPVIFQLGTIGGTSGFFPVQTFAVTPEQVAQLRAGLWYIQINSTDNPNGEIRGQLRAHHRHGDFEGDGLTDLAVFRPTEGKWYFLNSSDSEFRAQTLGGANDKIVTGDYDGDGIGDPAVFKSVNGLGYWEVRRSSSDEISLEQWGLADDRPVVGDFDGDGRTDLAVFRPSNGDWYIRNSSDNSFSAMHWGSAEDIPMVSDFDGDGRADLGVFRPSVGDWYINRSSDDTMLAMHWGLNGDIPQTGDFDGDGKADIVVFRPSDGFWYVHRSIDGELQAFNFGQSGDIPIAGDFDADDITDYAVFRPSNGTWYIIRSDDDAFVARQFGIEGDRPAARQQ